MNVYDTIIENIETEKSPWCQGSYEEVPYTEEYQRDSRGRMRAVADPDRPISRCLVGHVRFALGTFYVTVSKDGKVTTHRTKDQQKLAAQDRVLEHLASLIPGKHEAGAADHVIGWNDGDAPTSPKTKRAVVNLLRRASKRFPEDVAV